MTPAFKKRIAKLNMYQLVDALLSAAQDDGALGESSYEIYRDARKDASEKAYWLRDELKRRISELEENYANSERQLEYEREHPKSCECRGCRIG